MRRDFVKVALTALTVAICIATAMVYNKNTILTSGEKIMVKPVFTDNLSESYNRLKQDLKDKYAETIYNLIDKIKGEIAKETAKIFGESTLKKIEEAENLKAEIDEEKRRFFQEERYKSLQDKLVSLKETLALKDGDEEITKEMRSTLDKISTLNITIKNRLKEKTDRLKSLTDFVQEEFDKNKDALSNLKSKSLGTVKDEIIDCLDEFNEELSVLNKTFGKDDEEELPFDEETLKVDIPIFSYLPQVKDSETFVVSENDSPIKN